MRSGICPKCSSSEIYSSFSKGSLDAGIKAAGGQLLFNMHTEKGGLFGDKFKDLYLEYFVCRDCGYLESYAPDSLDQLAELGAAKNWQKVEQAKD